MKQRPDAGKKQSTLAAAFLALVREEADAPAVKFLRADGSVFGMTRGELLQAAVSFAGKLRETVPPGGVVALPLPTGPEFVCALYGCFLSGVAALPLPPATRTNGNRLSALLSRVRPDATVIKEKAETAWIGEQTGTFLT